MATPRLKQYFYEGFLPLIGAILLALIDRSLRWQRVTLAEIPENWLEKGPHILGFWHNQQLMLPFCMKREGRGKKPRQIYVLISAHRDGRMIARAISYYGFDSVAGSSSRGGREGAKKLHDLISGGDHIALTPDGPKGPIFQAKAGIIKLARTTGATIYPLAYNAERKWEFKSWDRMILPKPFSRAVLVIGKPLHLEETEDFEEQKQKVSVALSEAMDRANSHFSGS